MTLTGGRSPAAWAAKKATPTIPVVFVGIAYRVESCLVTSLARPSGNLTGFSIIGGELTPKRLEMLHELVPSGTTIAMLVDPNLRGGARYLNAAIEGVATKIGVSVPVLETGAPGDFEPVCQIGGASRRRAGRRCRSASPADARNSSRWPYVMPFR